MLDHKETYDAKHECCSDDDDELEVLLEPVVARLNSCTGSTEARLGLCAVEVVSLRLETCRLILRPFTETDAEDVFINWASDPQVTQYLTWPAHPNAEVTRKVVSDWVSGYADGGNFNWAIEWKETGRVIGGISVVRLEEATDEAEIGYCLGRAFWGRGIMPEALRAVMDYLFDTAEINRISAGHDVNNPKSGRVMERQE